MPGWFCQASSRGSLPFSQDVLRGLLLDFLIGAVQSSARKPPRNYGFSTGLGPFQFLWPAGGSVARQKRSAVSPPPFALEKNDRVLFATKSGRLLLSLSQVCWLVQTASEPFREHFVETLNKPIDT